VELLLLLLSVFAATLPMIAFVVVVVLMDRYEREPWWLVGVAFGWGAIGAVGLAVVGSLVILAPLGLLGEGFADFAGTTFVAPLVEEPAKALILLLIARSRHFDGATDGFVYGAAAGFGFAMSENFVYFATSAFEGSVGAWIGIVVVRTLFTAVMHGSATALVGAALGYARFRPWSTRLVVVPVGLLLAMTVHGLWNGPLALDEVLGTGGAVGLLAYVLFPVEFLALFGLYQVCLYGESVMIERELTAEAAAHGTLPSAHAPQLGSWLARFRARSWLPEGVDPKAYIEAATMLAFRRNQCRLDPGNEFCRGELLRLRAEVERQLR
jgi:protease PrsW